MSEPGSPGCPAPESFTEPVVIYTTRFCGYCMMALRLLRARNIVFAQVPVDGDRAARAWLEQRTGRHTVPQVFIGGTSVGGYDELSQLDDDGELMGLVAAAPGAAR
jgi:glutaredoxin 3